mgnify:CR=1 FL=1|tara:strand:- start:514 stop:735 length:222 start_codon:yes stop_codon:yes gene_type:complete
MSWKDIIKIDMKEYARSHFPNLPKEKNKTPMDKVTTTTSTGQDEEAAKRTENTEAELLAEIRARNKKARGDEQ